MAYTAEPVANADVKLALPFMPWISTTGKVITAVYENDETKVLLDAQMVDLATVNGTEGVVLPAAKNTLAGKKIITFIWDSLDTYKCNSTIKIVLRQERNRFSLLLKNNLRVIV